MLTGVVLLMVIFEKDVVDRPVDIATDVDPIDVLCTGDVVVDTTGMGELEKPLVVVRETGTDVRITVVVPAVVRGRLDIQYDSNELHYICRIASSKHTLLSEFLEG